VSARPQVPPGPYLVVGLARSGVAAALALAARGEKVIGLDAGHPAAAARLRERGVELHLGTDGSAELLERAGALIKSPGVPAHASIVAQARTRGLPVLGELELGWRLLPNEFIAVTGTNGKTTTVELVAHVLHVAGAHVAAAGNVGTAVCALVGEIAPETVVVCEASSFQLEDASAFAPEVAVLLNIAPDHLDRHGSMEAYERAKLRIFAAQRQRDTAVVPEPMLENVTRALAASGGGAPRLIAFGSGPGATMALRGDEMWWGEQLVLASAELSLRGAHNVENAMAAAAACLSRGVPIEAVREGLRSFAGVAHRLEEVATRDGVLYVNDSKATNVASTLVALAAFPGRRVHLILGGQGKGQDFAPLRAPVDALCAAAYLIGEDAPAIASELAGIGPAVHDCGDLEHALSACRGSAQPGEVVLLSPACASFDQFADFEARGERFRELATNGGISGSASK
jgi:UDP-N-acetylmuramoylalanine--D-glutamate ligase